jgi:uncharacterized cupredoxin-like copper-binding protein
MTVYFVIGSVLVVWALVLTFGGMRRGADFPDARTGKMLMAVSAGLAVAAFIAVVTTTEKEHPKQEAKEKAAKAAEAREAGQKQGKAQAVDVAEAEFSIKLPSKNLTPGPHEFDVVNNGRTEHDLAINGPKARKKTPLIKPGDRAKLEVDLVKGSYKLVCTVPGHEKAGMETVIDVR